MLKLKRIGFFGITRLLLSVWVFFPGEAMADISMPVSFEQKELIQVKVHRLIFDPTSIQAIIFLADLLEERALLIWIGLFEANAILSEMHGIKHHRPPTHDLLERIIRKANGKIHRIIITHHKEGIYYATIVMEMGGSPVEIDARPSDSVVMALKFKAPIFVSKTLFRDMAIPIEESEEIEKHFDNTLHGIPPSLVRCFSPVSTYGNLDFDISTSLITYRS